MPNSRTMQNPKWPPVGPKMANGVWKGVYSSVCGHSKQLSLNNFLDPSTPSMRKEDDGEKKRKKKKKKKEEKKRNKIMTFKVATNVIASRPPERRPTGTLHACAKIFESLFELELKYWHEHAAFQSVGVRAVDWQ